MAVLLLEAVSGIPYFQTVAEYLRQYGYVAIFFGVMLEDFGVPVPGESILVVGAVFAALGDLRVEWVGVLGFLGAVLGDNIGYFIGRWGGRRLLVRYGRYVFLTEQRLDQLEGFFQRHGGKVVTVARFIEGLRQFNGLIAGVSGMVWLRFLSFNILGAAVWVAFWVSISYMMGSHLGVLFSLFRHYEYWFFGSLGALIILYILYRLFIQKAR